MYAAVPTATNRRSAAAEPMIHSLRPDHRAGIGARDAELDDPLNRASANVKSRAD